MSKTKRRLKKALLAGAALYGASKMMKPDVSDAKSMRATEMNKKREKLQKLYNKDLDDNKI